MDVGLHTKKNIRNVLKLTRRMKVDNTDSRSHFYIQEEWTDEAIAREGDDVLQL
jgi:hypothetical protein